MGGIFGDGGGSTQTVSSNPEWLDRGGEELWKFGQSVFFDPNQADTYYGKSLADWGYKPNTANTQSTTPVSTNRVSSRSNIITAADAEPHLTPWERTSIPTNQWADYVNKRQGPTTSASERTSSAAGDMSLNNITPLPRYQGDRVSSLSSAERQAINLATGFGGGGWTRQDAEKWGRDRGLLGMGESATDGLVIQRAKDAGLYNQLERDIQQKNALASFGRNSGTSSRGGNQPYFGSATSSFNSARSSLGQASGATGSGYDTGMEYLSFGTPYIPASTERYSTDFSRAPEAMPYYVNPYIEGALDVTARKLREDYERDARREQGRAKSAGAFGGTRQAVADALEKEDYRESLSDMYRVGLTDAYDRAGQTYLADEARLTGQFNEEQDRLQSAADLFRSFAGTGADIGYGAADRYRQIGDSYTDVGRAEVEAARAQQDVLDSEFGRLIQAGALERGVDQARIDADYADFLEQRDYPRDVMAELASILNGSSSRNSLRPIEDNNSAAQTLGGLGSLASGGAALWMASDNRLKTDTHKVGTHTIRGVEIPVYRFRYAGDDSKAHHIGVMANDVETIMPEAVIEAMGGLKMVDYQAIGLA